MPEEYGRRKHDALPDCPMPDCPLMDGEPIERRLSARDIRVIADQSHVISDRQHSLEARVAVLEARTGDITIAQKEMQRSIGDTQREVQAGFSRVTEMLHGHIEKDDKRQGSILRTAVAILVSVVGTLFWALFEFYTKGLK